MTNNKPVKNIENFYPRKEGNILKAAVKEYITKGYKKVLRNYIVGFLFNQMSAKEGIKSFGDKVLIVLYNECLQLYDTSTFYSIKAK